MRRRHVWMLALVPLALPLLWWPLGAQEPAAEAPRSTPAETPAAKEPSPAADAAAEPAPKDTAPEEQVSADNNLSFPVDI
jgi:hypothetical protein